MKRVSAFFGFAVMITGTRHWIVSGTRWVHFTSVFFTHVLVVLGGLVVIVLAIGTKIREFRPGRGRWIFLRAIKIRSTTSFGGEVKPSIPCRKILRHVKGPCCCWI
jgi:hypothetical protein